MVSLSSTGRPPVSRRTGLDTSVCGTASATAVARRRSRGSKQRDLRRAERLPVGRFCHSGGESDSTKCTEEYLVANALQAVDAARPDVTVARAKLFPLSRLVAIPHRRPGGTGAGRCRRSPQVAVPRAEVQVIKEVYRL